MRDWLRRSPSTTLAVTGWVIAGLAAAFLMSEVIAVDFGDSSPPGYRFSVTVGGAQVLSLELPPELAGVLKIAHRTTHPPAPPAGFDYLYPLPPNWFFKNPAGVQTALPGTGGGGGTGPDVSVLVRLNTTIQVPNNADVVIPWPTPIYQSGGTWWTAGQPTRLTPPVAGKYALDCAGNFLSNATGFRQFTLKENGLFTGPRENKAGITGTNTKVLVTHQDSYAVGDYLEASVVQTSGGTLGMSGGTGGQDTQCGIYKFN
jgi:hypothetical protein